MQFYLRKLLILSVIAITSCSHFHGSNIIQNRGTDYLKAESIPPLKIPPGLSSSTIHEEYPVSNQDYPGSREEINLAPPGLGGAVDNSLGRGGKR